MTLSYHTKSLLTSFCFYANVCIVLFGNNHFLFGGNPMPVLIVYGIPNDVGQGKLESLIRQLQMAASAPLGLWESEISVFFPVDLVQNCLGEELICSILGLFEKPERTNAIRQHLADSVLRSLEGFAILCLPQCGKVEVIVNRFNQDADGFATRDPRKKK